jgi:hypothetical protein
MAKPNSKEKILKKLYNQLSKHSQQSPVRRKTTDSELVEPAQFVFTRRGRIENKIELLEKSNKR